MLYLITKKNSEQIKKKEDFPSFVKGGIHVECIENDQLCLQVSSQGAEMYSLIYKPDGRECLWQGDKKYWKWHAPICFPIVGLVQEGTTTADGRPVRLTVHGFARDRKFRLLRRSANEIVYELLSDAESLAVYPYAFALRVGYTLTGNQLKTTYEVENKDGQTLYFSLGAHTAYRCPVDDQGEFADLELVFPGQERLERSFYEGEFRDGQTGMVLLSESGVLPLRQAMFARGVFAFQNPGTKRVQLRQKSSGKSLEVEFGDFPYLGLWTKAEGAPFLCIEPWHGLTDGPDKLPFEEKEGICSLAVGGRFSASYTITVN